MKTQAGLSQDEALARCEEILGYRFQNRELLLASLIHASGARSRLESNERLEFLGDAVLGLVICDELYRRLPDALEGELTKVKSAAVSRRTCAIVTKEIGLDEALFLGKGMMGRKSLPPSLLAAVFESVIGAVYLDGGYAAAREIILRLTAGVLEEMTSSQNHCNFKSQLQQYAQRDLNSTPIYELLDEQGPDHSKCFEICVRLAGKRFPSAWGPSKKEAEQLAAQKALIKLGLLPEPDPED